MDGLAAARAERDTANDRVKTARSDLQAASILAKGAIDELDGTLDAIAKKHQLSPSTLSKLSPQTDDGGWEPRRMQTYQAVDDITRGQYQLAELRAAFDKAVRQLKEAGKAVLVAEARADRPSAAPRPRPADNPLVIDDVLVERHADRVVLDTRVRNTGAHAANITRAAVRIVDRTAYLTAYATSANYDLKVDGDYTEIGVAQMVKPDDVDRFTLTLGFADRALGCVFIAELVLHVNGGRLVVSEPFTFDSCFE